MPGLILRQVSEILSKNNGLRKKINKGGLSSAFSICLIYVMKLSDIKGDIAVKVNEILYTKFEEYLNEFILELPEKYKSTIKQEHSNPGRTLFSYNKDLKNFLLTGRVHLVSNHWYTSYDKNKSTFDEDAKALGLVQGKGFVENFKFENKYFSGNISISSHASCKAWGDCGNSIYHRADVSLKIKDIDALMKELDQALGNKTLGHKKLKDARGVEIKVGDIVVCSDSHYAGVWLAKVLSLSDVMISVSGSWGKINKYPKDVIIVSREAITKK